MKPNQGFTLPEILLGGVLAVGTILLTVYGMAIMSRTDSLMSQKGDTATQLVFANRLIQRMGRVASQCQKSATTPAALQCYIDFSRPASGKNQWIQFLVANGRLEYQWDTNNDGDFTMTRTVTRWDQISDLTICDNEDMHPSTGTCPLQPVAMSRLYYEYANGATGYTGSGRSDRYFRYRLTSVPVSVTNATNSAQIASIQQGAFYIRNPTASGLVFQW